MGSWLRNKTNRELVLLVLKIATPICVGIWAVFTHYHPLDTPVTTAPAFEKPPFATSPISVSADSGSVAAGHDISGDVTIKRAKK